MRLSVVIVSWNTGTLLARCLESAAREIQHMRTTGVETFVVDNASADGSGAMVRARFPWVRLIENRENLGFAAANNQAMRQATGRFVLLLNSDTEVQPGAVQHLVNALERHPNAGAVGPRMLNPDGSLQNSYGPLPSVLSEIVGPYLFESFTAPWGRIGACLWASRLENSECIAVDRVSFACTMIRRKALEQVGLLDERFLFYSEDYDWFKRLKEAGWQAVFCPQSRVTHHWGASSALRSDWSLRQLYRSKRLYYAKHYGPVTEAVLRLGLSLGFALKAMIAFVQLPVRKEASIKRGRLQLRLLEDMLGPVKPD